MPSNLGKKLFGAALVAAGCGLTGVASASHIPGISFTEQSFTIDPTAYCATCAPFTATFIDFSYTAEVDQTGGTFDETGAGFFGSFRDTLGGAPDPDGQDFLQAANFYSTFSGAGTTAVNGSGGIDGTFTTFNVSMLVDPNKDTVCTYPAIGAPDGSTTCTGTADDVTVLQGTLQIGGFHVFPGLAAGDFDVLFNVTSFDSSFWGGTAFSGSDVQGDYNGVNTQISGVSAPPSDFIDGRIIGSGNASFASVPEPGVLALLAVGLLGMGAFRRRSNG